MSAKLAWAEERLQARDLQAAVWGFDAAAREDADGDRCADADRSAGADRCADSDRCAGGRWLASMLRGEFEAAWCECDAVQFLRYVPALQAMVSELIVEVPPPMVELAQCFDGLGRVISWGDAAPAEAPEWEVQVEINELPYLFRTQAAELPWATEYLRVPAEWLAAARPEAVCGRSLRVGVVWACGEWNPARSIPLAMLEPVLRTRGCEFWNLQGGGVRGEWARLERRSGLHAAQGCGASLTHLAALIAQLDLVITPDTLAAHLAGAQGVAAWVMLPYAADWRWQHGREDSPWYPTLRLFRQRSPGDWEGVAGEVQCALERYAAAFARCGAA